MGVLDAGNLGAARTTAGKARQFSLPDVLVLATVKKLGDLGISPMRAAGWAKMMVRWMDRLGPQMTEWNIRIYGDSESVLPDDELMSEKPAPGARFKLTIYPGEIVADLKSKLAGQTE
jgi:hypothetical protein